jgi:hypothetical protein
MNGFTNVRVRNFCAGNTNGAASLWLHFNKPNPFGLVQGQPGAKCISTLTVKLDDMVARGQLDCLDYLKSDARGAQELGRSTDWT